MYLLSSLLTGDQISFLKNAGIQVSELEYSADEIGNLYFDVMDALQNNLGDEIVSPDEFSKKCSEILSILAPIANG